MKLNKRLKKIIILVLISIVYLGARHFGIYLPISTHKGTNKNLSSTGDNTPVSGNQFSDVGKVLRVFSDDISGIRHQRFILKLPSNQTILIAHNIDIAPRVPSLKEGDTIYFSGVYEENSKGGVVHWTHHDPQRHHKSGWLRKNGKIYQ